LATEHLLILNTFQFCGGHRRWSIGSNETFILSSSDIIAWRYRYWLDTFKQGIRKADRVHGFLTIAKPDQKKDNILRWLIHNPYARFQLEQRCWQRDDEATSLLWPIYPVGIRVNTEIMGQFSKQTLIAFAW